MIHMAYERGKTGRGRNMSWVSLAKHWNSLQRKAAERNSMHPGAGTVFDAGPVAVHLKGLCGEKVVSVVSNLPLDEGLYYGGDDGCDFVVNGSRVDVKTSTYLRSPDLKINCDVDHWADLYILVVLDMPRKRARLAGWASQEQVKAAATVNYGYGDRFSVPEYNIKRWAQTGLPPCFGTVEQMRFLDG